MTRDWIDSQKTSPSSISRFSILLLIALFSLGVIIGMVLRGKSSLPMTSPVLDQGEVIFLFDYLGSMTPFRHSHTI